MKSAMFPGSFDPFHEGHADLVTKALKVFDEVAIVVSRNPEKIYRQTSAARVSVIEKLYDNNPRVKVLQNDNKLTIDFAHENSYKYILRGLRNQADFNYEAKLAKFYSSMDETIELVYFYTTARLEKISSTELKEIEKYRKENNYE